MTRSPLSSVPATSLALTVSFFAFAFAFAFALALAFAGCAKQGHNDAPEADLHTAIQPAVQDRDKPIADLATIELRVLGMT